MSRNAATPSRRSSLCSTRKKLRRSCANPAPRPVRASDSAASVVSRTATGESSAIRWARSTAAAKQRSLPEEPEGDDHYRDFVDTVSFLAGPFVWTS